MNLPYFSLLLSVLSARNPDTSEQNDRERFYLLKAMVIMKKLLFPALFLICLVALYGFREIHMLVNASQKQGNVATLSHILIHTSDMESSLTFYQETLEMRVHEKAEAEGEIRYFLSNNDSHHQLVLMEQPEVAESDQRVIQQIAFNVPDHASLLKYYQRLKDRHQLELKNNQISWSIYLHDPDDNQIEIYWDVRQQPFGSAKWNGKTEVLTEEVLLKGRP